MCEKEETQDKKQSSVSLWRYFNNCIVYILPCLSMVALVGAISFLFASILSGILGDFSKIESIKGGQTQIISLPDQVDRIPNDTLLSILSILIAFAGLLAYIFQKIVHKELKEIFDKEILATKEEIKTLAHSERAASRAENLIVESFTLSELINTLETIRRVCDGCKDPPCTIQEHERIRRSQDSYLKTAIDFDRKAYKSVKDLDLRIYADVIVKSLNSLVCDLTEYYKKDHSLLDKTLSSSDTKIFELNKKLLEYFETQEVKSHHDITEEDRIVWQETTKGVKYFFEVFDNEQEKIKIRDWLQSQKVKVSQRMCDFWERVYDLKNV